jgi:hypothetical protein
MINISLYYFTIITGILINDKFIFILFHKLYPTNYVYDMVEKWDSINEYGIYRNEHCELISTKNMLVNNLYQIILKRFNTTIFPNIHESKENVN